jgi:Xaa-Pro aminopeptidase
MPLTASDRLTDGRYTLQLAEQTDPDLWERAHIIEQPPATWLAAAFPEAGAHIGYDPWLISEEGLARFTAAGLNMVPTANLVDAIWHDRPAAPSAAAVPHPLDVAGQDAADKRADIAGKLMAARQDAAVLTDPASIAWLLNSRGEDVPYTPYALGFALLHADARADLFMDGAKLPSATRAWLGNSVRIRERAELPEALAALAGKRVRVDAAGSPSWFSQTLRAAGAEVVAGIGPCLLPKACKNPTEQQGARDAHARDAVAVCRFLHFMSEAGPAGTETELSAAERLVAFRRDVPGFRGESFPAISGAGEHGAVIHYRVTPESNRSIRPDEVYLIDSGAQFPDGTTDITRTIWTGRGTPPNTLRDRFTRVLKGHIAIATLVFPQGVAGPHLDSFARRTLWQAGLDYDHGTGHGVGSYLSVHEGPAGLSRAARPVPLAPGMILSNEPGYYLPGAYGIRLENLLLVAHSGLEGTEKPFLHFETLTLAPFDRTLIAPALLTAEERAWIDSYHARVRDSIGPHLSPPARAWLNAVCAPLASPSLAAAD